MFREARDLQAGSSNAVRLMAVEHRECLRPASQGALPPPFQRQKTPRGSNQKPTWQLSTRASPCSDMGHFAGYWGLLRDVSGCAGLGGGV